MVYRVGYEEEENWKMDDQFEPLGLGPIAIGSVTKNVAFWRTFVIVLG